MKTWMVVAMLGGIGWAPVAQANGRLGEDIAICVGDNLDPYVSGHAELQASLIFRRVGIQLNWHMANSTFCMKNQGPIIHVTYSLKTPVDLSPGTLAYAMPFDGTHVEVFSDRIRAKNDTAVARVLGYVLAHEICHILQGTDHHSDAGIMKARWHKADIDKLATGNVTFTAEDVSQMHAGFASWAERAQQAPVLAMVKP